MFRSTLIAALLLASLSSHATTVYVEGLVTGVENDSHLLPITAAPGDPFSILYTLTDIAPMDAYPDPMQGSYSGVVQSMTVTIGSQSFLVSGYAGVLLTENFANGVDSWTLLAHRLLDPGSPLDAYKGSVSIFTQRSGPSSDAFIPFVPLTAGLRHDMSFGVSEGSGNDAITATITSITPVPLPAAAWLFLSGLAGLVGLSRPASNRAGRNGWPR
jgi:hypothetical protein